MDISPLRRLRDSTLLLSVLFVLASSAPAPNAERENTMPSKEPLRRELSDSWKEAREIWNGVRVLKKQHAQRRERRMVADPTPSTISINETELLNLSIPTYMKELYWNISKHDSRNRNSEEATTIRSLPAIHTGNSESHERSRPPAPAHYVHCGLGSRRLSEYALCYLEFFAYLQVISSPAMQ